MRYLALAVLGAIVSYLSYVFIYTGAFKPVHIEIADPGPEFQMLYKEHVGPYHEIDRTITEVEEWMAERNLRCASSFGHYLDDPSSTDEDRLRSHGGCLVSVSPPELPDRILFKKLEPRPYARALFSGSPGLGPVKVYPKVTEYLSEKGFKLDGPILEVYTLKGANRMETQYYFPIRK